MWRRPLKSTVLVIATHKKLKKVSDGTSTQVIAQMINKCRIKMIHEELHNVRDLPRTKGTGKTLEGTLQQSNLYLYSVSTDLYERESPRTGNLFIFVSVVLFELSFKLILAVVQFISAQFFNPLSTNLLSWAHWVNISHILGLGRKQRSYKILLLIFFQKKKYK